MNPTKVQPVMTAARDCALVMLESATYIQRELPNVQMDDSIRATTEELCSALVGTKHDMFTEAFELDELLAAEASESDILVRVNRIVQWLWQDVERMHQLVTALESASKRDPAFGLAYLLIAESATNILQAFNRTRAAADQLKSQAG